MLPTSTTADFSNSKGFAVHFQTVLSKLQKDPLTITADDARCLHEHFDAKDDRSARMVSAVEALALANQDLRPEKGEAVSISQDGHASLLTVVGDLLAGPDANPEDVTMEVLKMTQTAVSKCQKAIGHTTVSHPELEHELQGEYAKIEHRVAGGTVTLEEANHLHYLEARAHGHIVKSGLASIAQSVAAKSENHASLNDASNILEYFTLGDAKSKRRSVRRRERQVRRRRKRRVSLERRSCATASTMYNVTAAAAN